MDPELDKRLKAIEYKLNENQHILKRIRRVQRNSGLLRLFYWLVIIGIAFGSFYYIAPYLKQIREAYGQFNNGTIKFNFPELNNIQNLLKQIDEKEEISAQ